MAACDSCAFAGPRAGSMDSQWKNAPDLASDALSESPLFTQVVIGGVVYVQSNGPKGSYRSAYRRDIFDQKAGE